MEQERPARHAGETVHATKTTVHYALAANLAIALVKGAAGVLTGSAALLAETAHSLADTGNQVRLRISLSRAEKPPDEEHPFGYGRERFFWALLVAVLIFVGGALFWSGARREGWSFRGYLDASTDPTAKTVLFEDSAASDQHAHVARELDGPGGPSGGVCPAKRRGTRHR